MIDAVIDRIRALDHDQEHRSLTEHVVVTCPVALELLAYEHLTSQRHEAQRIAGVQLRVVHELAGRLRWLESMSLDPQLPVSVRVALAAVMRSLCGESDLLPVIDSEATALLEPALLFHSLLSRLRPWLPPMMIALEPDTVVEMLQLGFPDYLHPLLRQRFDSLWALFHRLRQLPPSRLELLPNLNALDDERLQRLSEVQAASERLCPPTPMWTTPCWSTPWLDLEESAAAPLPRTTPRVESSGLTG